MSLYISSLLYLLSSMCTLCIAFIYRPTVSFLRLSRCWPSTTFYITTLLLLLLRTTGTGRVYTTFSISSLLCGSTYTLSYQYLLYISTCIRYPSFEYIQCQLKKAVCCGCVIFRLLLVSSIVSSINYIHVSYFTSSSTPSSSSLSSSYYYSCHFFLIEFFLIHVP